MLLMMESQVNTDQVASLLVVAYLASLCINQQQVFQKFCQSLKYIIIGFRKLY